MNKPTETTWISAHIHCFEPWEKLLSEAVLPFVESAIEQDKIQSYFFIRYWEKGPHIRLRLLCNNPQSEIWKHETAAYFEKYLNENAAIQTYPEEYIAISNSQNWHAINTVHWIDYEPEIERYGGMEALKLAEDLFHYNSHLALKIIRDAEEWDYDSILGIAIQMHLVMAKALGMSKSEAAAFFFQIFIWWSPMAMKFPPNQSQAEMENNLKNTFEQQFQTQQEVLKPYVIDVWNMLEIGSLLDPTYWNEYYNSVTAIYHKLTQLQKSKKITFPAINITEFDTALPSDMTQLWKLYGSYVHMTNNRIGVNNREESYLGYLLWRCLQ